MLLKDFLTQNGFGFKPEPKYDNVIVLTGEWISPMDQDAFADDARIEHIDGPVYRVSDCSGVYRLEVFTGGGPNGQIGEWLDWEHVTA